MARVSDVREASRKDKERVARGKRESSRPAGIEKGLGVTFYKQGVKGPMSSTPPASAARKAIQGNKKPTNKALERGYSPRDSANVKASGPRRGGEKLGVVKGQEQRFRPAPKYPSRQGGMDTQTNKKKSIVGKVIDRVTQPPKELSPASKKMLAEARAEITPVVTALAGGRLLYKGGKKLVEAGMKYFSKPKPVPSKPSSYKPSGKNVMPKRSNARVKRTPGTYTQFDRR